MIRTSPSHPTTESDPFFRGKMETDEKEIFPLPNFQDFGKNMSFFPRKKEKGLVKNRSKQIVLKKKNFCP